MLSALQDVSPNAFSDLMVYDEENVLLNSTEAWDGMNPKGRAGTALNSQRQRWELRQGAAEDEAPLPDFTPEEGNQGWSMVGTNAALALTQEILRQSLEQALRCPEAMPKSRKLTQAQKEALFARIAAYIETHGGRLLEVFRRFDKDKSGAVDVIELQKMLESLGMTFTSSERQGLLQLFDVNGDARVSYKEFLDICSQNAPAGSKGMGAKHASPRSAGPSSSQSAAPSSVPRSTSQYQQYLSKMSTSDGMAERKPVASSTKKIKKKSSAPPAPTQAIVEQPAEVESKLAFALEFTNVTEGNVEKMAKKSKRHCVQVKKELVILPANRRPRRAALLAASQKAEKYRQSWDTLSKLVAAQGEGMVQETLAAMRCDYITEDNLVSVVHELVHRFPVPLGDEAEVVYIEGVGQAANSMGPLYATGSPAPAGRDMYGDDSDSTDSEDDMGDLRLLGLVQE